MDKLIERTIDQVYQLKKWLVLAVLLLMVVIVAASIIELAIVVVTEMTDEENEALFLDIGEFLKIFGFVFMTLIGFELLESIATYFKKNIIHAEVVILIAVIAVSRKVILLDLEKYEPLALIGLALIMVALGLSYYLIKRANVSRRTTAGEH